MQELLGAGNVTVYVLDSTKNELRAKASVHPTDVTVRYAIGSGAVGEAAAARRVVNVAISVPSPDRTRGRAAAQSHTAVVAVPIKSCRGRVLGVVEVRGQHSPSATSPIAFTHEDELLLTWVSSQLAFVLERRDMEREWRDLQKQATSTGQSEKELHAKVAQLTAAGRQLRQALVDSEASLETATSDLTATRQALTENQAQLAVLQRTVTRLQDADKQLVDERNRRYVWRRCVRPSVSASE